MPTTYAHWAFGRDCLNRMPGQLQEIVTKHRDIYDFGVHGPDILFYYLPNPKVDKLGIKMHMTSASVVFSNFKKSFDRFKDKDEMLAYILGYLTHFTLDSECHTYVEAKRKHSNITHNRVEAQWDRHQMLIDGKTPNLVDRAESLKPSKANAKVISYFYPYKEKEVLKYLKYQKAIVTLSNAISPRKEKAYRYVLNKLKQYSYADIFIGFEEFEECKDSNLRLDKLRKKALNRFPKLLKELLAYLYEDRKLGKYFENNFEDRKNEKVDILPYEEELNYIVK